MARKTSVAVHRALQVLHEQGEQHGVLAARDADRDPIPCLHQTVFLHRIHERTAQCAHKFALERAPDVLTLR